MKLNPFGKSSREKKLARIFKRTVIIPNLTNRRALEKLGYRFHKVKLRRIWK